MYENLKDSGDREEYIAWMDDTERAMQEIEAAEKESRNLSVVGEMQVTGKIQVMEKIQVKGKIQEAGSPFSGQNSGGGRRSTTEPSITTMASPTSLLSARVGSAL